MSNLESRSPIALSFPGMWETERFMSEVLANIKIFLLMAAEYLLFYQILKPGPLLSYYKSNEFFYALNLFAQILTRQVYLTFQGWRCLLYYNY